MERLDSRRVYEGFGIDVEIRRYRRLDGTEVERQVVEHPGSVAILAHDEEFVYLVAQPREVVEEDALLEIPAGTLDHAGESELECARRELAEEAELAAAEWTELAKIYPSPGFVSEVVTIFLATGLSPASGERDEDEDIDIVRLPIAELGEALPGHPRRRDAGRPDDAARSARRLMAQIHVLERKQRIERPLAEVFPFYADAGNLERITPPWLGFEVTDAAADRDAGRRADRVQDQGPRRAGEMADADRGVGSAAPLRRRAAERPLRRSGITRTPSAPTARARRSSATASATRSPSARSARSPAPSSSSATSSRSSTTAAMRSRRPSASDPPRRAPRA